LIEHHRAAPLVQGVKNWKGDMGTPGLACSSRWDGQNAHPGTMQKNFWKVSFT
jgi:hypothetical protein